MTSILSSMERAWCRSGTRAVIAVALIGSLALAACTDRSRAANAGLRDRIHELESRNNDLEQRNRELEIQVAEVIEDADPPVSADHAEIPVVTSIVIDGTSGRRSEPDGAGQRPLEVHVKAFDGRRRPIQLAGRLRVQVTRLAEGQPPVEVAAVDLSPAELRDAWRGGFMGGTTWMVSVPVQDGDLEGVDAVAVDVFYEDLRTGQELTCGDKVDIR
ncbi:MAG: bZIP transcription factor [Phycisphaerales bacterium]|nr:bZIP transcription factor [Phycisphaerales bacterium]